MSGILVPKTQLASSLELITPETQKAAALELNTMMSQALQEYIGKNLDEQHLYYMRQAIKDTLQAWFKKHPVWTKLNIDFQLEVDHKAGKIKIVPSFDFQRLILGMIPY